MVTTSEKDRTNLANLIIHFCYLEYLLSSELFLEVPRARHMLQVSSFQKLQGSSNIVVIALILPDLLHSLSKSP